MEVVLAIFILLFCLLVIVFLREVRERKGLQERLKQKIRETHRISRTFDAVFQSIHAYVLLLDRNMVVYQTNYYERTGRIEPPEAAPKRLGELLCCAHCADGQECGTTSACKDCVVRRLITQAFLQRRGFPDQEADLVLHTTQNKKKPIHALIAGSYIDMDGMDNMVVTIHDITELTESKLETEKWQRVVAFISSASKVGFAALDLTTRDEIITPEYSDNLCEAPSARAVKVFHNFGRLYPEDRERALDFIRRATEGKVEPMLTDVRVMTGGDKENMFKWVRLFLMQKELPVDNPSNEIYSLTLDVTATKKLEEELIAEREKAIEADRAKTTFLANMSHEIRTPLNAIMGFSDLLMEAESVEEKMEFKQVLKTNANMLLQLINDILDLAKIEAGTLDFNYADVNVTELMNDMNAVFSLKMQEAEHPVKLLYEPMNRPVVLHVDRNRLGQVISNFLSNAVKFTDEGYIRFGFKPCAAGFYFYVSDTGAGIPEDKRAAVFQRFARFHTQKQGNGLGLSISKTIIEKLGGTIGFNSIAGKGSTFWFILPTQNIVSADHGEHSMEENPEPPAMPEVQKTEAPKPTVVAPVQQMAPDANGRKTVLIAEDMEDNFRLCEVVLSKLYRVIWARDGEEAISRFLEYQPDVILMDLKMPGVDGYQATAAIREVSQAVPIVAFTAFAFAEDKQRVMDSGFNDYMTKPAKAQELIDKVKKYT